MKNTFNQFLAAYKQAPLSLKQFIDSEEIGIFIDTLPGNELNKTNKQKLLVLISNRILNVITEEILLTELLQFVTEANEVQLIYSKIKDFVAEILKRTASTSNTTDLMSNEIAEAEAVIESLPQFRTMQTLASNNEAVYTSTQAAILQEGAGLPVPPPPSSNEPRWDTSR